MWGFFLMKTDQREKKGTFTRYVKKKKLKLIFDRICIPPTKKIGVYRTSAVRSFVCPPGRHTFSSLRHFLGRGYLLVNFNYCTSVILIPLLSTDLTLLLWFPNLKEATK